MIVDREDVEGAEEQAYAEWTEVSRRWDEDATVLVIGTVDGAPVAAVMGGPDPEVYSPAWNTWSVNVFDESTFTPKQLSEVSADVEGLEVFRRYGTVREWYDAEVVDKGP